MPFKFSAGEDAAILDNTEQLNEEVMYAIYEENSEQLNLFEDTQETGMSFIEAEEVLRQIKRQDSEKRFCSKKQKTNALLRTTVNASTKIYSGGIEGP